jgi:hypothetical protein
MGLRCGVGRGTSGRRRRLELPARGGVADPDSRLADERAGAKRQCFRVCDRSRPDDSACDIDRSKQQRWVLPHRQRPQNDDREQDAGEGAHSPHAARRQAAGAAQIYPPQALAAVQRVAERPVEVAPALGADDQPLAAEPVVRAVDWVLGQRRPRRARLIAGRSE